VEANDTDKHSSLLMSKKVLMDWFKPQNSKVKNLTKKFAELDKPGAKPSNTKIPIYLEENIFI
jgi:hypothetical protein